MLVKHKKYGIGEGRLVKSGGLDLIKVNFPFKTITFTQKALDDGVLELIDDKKQLNKGQNTTPFSPITNSKIDFIISKYVEDFKSKKDLPFVVKDSIPVVYFGDLDAYLKSSLKVITIGLNPSLQEFKSVDKFGVTQPLSNPRFNTDINFNSVDCVMHLKSTLNNYFKNNPYKWFNKYEKLLNAIERPDNHVSCSYYSNAIHVDVYSAIATNPTWGGLSESQKNQVKNTYLFKQLLDYLSPDRILISVNMQIFNALFGNWNYVCSYDFPGNNKIIVKEKNGKIVINGTNMMGVPFGGMEEKQVKSIIKKQNTCKVLLPFPDAIEDSGFIIIFDKNNEMQAQPLYVCPLNERVCYMDDKKIVVFTYQLKVLSDTGFNSMAWTTQENWDNRLTSKFDASLVGEIYFHNRHIRDFESAKRYLEKLGFSSDNIIDQTNNCFARLGRVQDL